MGPAHGGKGGVSHKIQQLLNTLKRPKKNRRPIEDYYHDDESGMCVCVSSNILLSFTSLLLPPPLSPGTREEDPSAPRPVGPTMQPAVGVPLESRQDWHRNLEAAIQHHSSTLAKHPAISVVDPHGKVSVAATYSKERTHAHTHTQQTLFSLLSSLDKLAGRSQKIAYYMLHKLGGGKLVQPGDRVALVFRPDEAAQFATAFYGCIFGAVIPVAIEPPVTREVRACVCLYGGRRWGWLSHIIKQTDDYALMQERIRTDD